MSDTLRQQTEYGEIAIDSYAIGTLILETLEEFKGRIRLSNKRGHFGIMGKFSDFGEVDNMEIEFDKNGAPVIRLYVVLRFGISISKTTNALLDRIEENLETVLGRKPASLSVVVSGVMSKKIGRRNIEVHRDYENK